MKDATGKCKGYSHCEREIYTDGMCKLHLSPNHVKALTCEQFDTELLNEISEATEKENGLYALYWHGLKFPNGHVLFDFLQFDEVANKLKKCWINIEHSEIQDIRIGGYDIHQLIIFGSTINGNTMIPVVNIDRLSLGTAVFKGKFHCASRTREFDARGARFEDEFSFAAEISEMANLTGCRFKEACLFHSIHGKGFGSKSFEEFEVVGFNNSIFADPSHTRFQDIDLRKASFDSVPLVGAHFHNVNFNQEPLKRNGLFNEVRLLKKNRLDQTKSSSDGIDASILRHHRNLIHEYRQLRMALENSKDFEKASDFYVGEMKARQRRRWNLIIALYGISSHFGTNYVRAFCVLLLILSIHLFLTITIDTNLQLQKLFIGPEIIGSWKRLGELVIHTLSTGALQRVGLLENPPMPQNFVDILFRILVPVQAAMFVLALRHKTKR